MRIAIAGYGQEGASSLTYYRALGHEMAIADEREILDSAPRDVLRITGPEAFTNLGDFDQIIRSPGVNPRKLPYKNRVWSATNEFFEKCPAPVIGVTGTKGKGTTSSLTASILQAAGKNVHLVGNIGVPALDILPEIRAGDIVVFELSSFQLWDIARSPQVAVVLGIEADHLNVHDDFEDYISAKARIRAYQTAESLCVYHPSNAYSERIARSVEVGRTVRYDTNDDTNGVFVENDSFMTGDRVICTTDVLQIPGRHNIENACAAITAALAFTDDYEAIEAGLRQFSGLEHRIKFIREIDGVRYYDDSYSSAPSAALAAVSSFEEPVILLLGGVDKGADFDAMASSLSTKSQLKHVVAYGQTGSKIAELLREHGMVNVTLANTDFAEVIETARRYAARGDVVVLSPACASFDMFDNFAERGRIFSQYIERIV